MKQEHKEGKSFYGNKLSFRGEKQDSAKKKICQPGVINGGWCMHRASLVHVSLLKHDVFKWKWTFGSWRIDVADAGSIVEWEHKQHTWRWFWEWGRGQGDAGKWRKSKWILWSLVWGQRQLDLGTDSSCVTHPFIKLVFLEHLLCVLHGAGLWECSGGCSRGRS